MNKKKEEILFGADESNHGAHPEFFSLVSSFNKEDSFQTDHKIRGPTLWENFSPNTSREMRYCILSKEESKLIQEYRPLVYLIPKLIDSFPFFVDKGTLYVDGFLRKNESDFIKKEVQLNRKIKNLEVICVPKKEDKGKTNKIIALADGTAYYLFVNEKKHPGSIRGSSFFKERQLTLF
jgi:hypothetical protein